MELGLFVTEKAAGGERYVGYVTVTVAKKLRAKRIQQMCYGSNTIYNQKLCFSGLSVNTTVYDSYYKTSVYFNSVAICIQFGCIGRCKWCKKLGLQISLFRYKLDWIFW